MGSVVDAYCNGCQYLGTNSYGKWCRYNDVTGRARRCPAGTGCDKYAAGPPKRVPNASLFEHKIPEKKPKPEIPPKPPKKAKEPAAPKEKKPPMTPEELYERDKERKKEAAMRLREKAQGRQKAAIDAYKAQTGLYNFQIAELVGVSASTFQKWASEYSPADWDKLAKIGIQRPEGL